MGGALQSGGWKACAQGLGFIPCHVIRMVGTGSVSGSEGNPKDFALDCFSALLHLPESGHVRGRSSQLFHEQVSEFCPSSVDCPLQAHSNETIGSVRWKIAKQLCCPVDNIQIFTNDSLVGAIAAFGP